MRSCAKFVFAALVLLAVFVAAHPTAKQESVASDDDSNRKFRKTARIAVLGGGPAGLFAARQLVKGGYTSVTVFEQASAPMSIHTKVIDGIAVDFTARFLPSVNPEGPGLYAPFQQMITEYGLTTRPTSSAISYIDNSGPQPMPLPLPPFLATFFAPGGSGAIGIVSELVWGWEVLRTVYAAQSIPACHAALNVPAGTSFAAWAQAVNKPAFTKLAAFSNDVFLGGPSSDQDVCAFLKIRSHFMPSDILSVLKAFGVTNTTPLPISSALRSCLNPAVDVRRRMFDNGYISFFNTLIEREQLNVRFNSKVTAVELLGNSRVIRVTLEDGTSANFDKVVVAMRPQHAIAVLKDDLDMLDLLALAKNPTKIHVHGFTTTSVNPYAQVFNSVLYPTSMLLGSSSMPVGVVGLNKESSASSLIVAIGYANNDGSSQDEEDRAKAAIRSFGYEPAVSQFGAVIPYPNTITATVSASGWHSQAASLQGTSGYVFVGELFSGYGVPSVLEDTTRTIQTQFFKN